MAISLKPIKSFHDVKQIINGRRDVRDERGNRIPFSVFASMPLISIDEIVEEGGWQYELTDSLPIRPSSLTRRRTLTPEQSG